MAGRKPRISPDTHNLMLLGISRHDFYCHHQSACRGPIPSISYPVCFQLRPTPPHLTSAAAEAILAQACENESNNAKRMRMGLDPLPVSRHSMVKSEMS